MKLKFASTEFGLALIFCASLLGMSFYRGASLVYLLTFVYFLALLLRKNITIKINTGTVLIFSVVFFYFLGMLLTNYSEIYKVNVQDIINIVSLIMVLLIIQQNGTEEHGRFIEYFRLTSVPLMTIIAAVGLYKYYLLSKGIYLNQFYFNGYYAFGTSLSSDNNMFSLAMFVGFILSITGLSKSQNFKLRVYYLLSSLTITGAICFSGSRRAFLMMMLVYAIVAFKYFKNVLSRKYTHIKLIVTSYIAIWVVIFGVIFTVYSDFDISKVANDPQIRTTIERFSSIGKDNIGESFNPRVERWAYSLELFGSLSLPEQLFGSGFNYVSAFSDKYNLEIEDYPHNPILSAILYSGIIGSLFLLLLFIATLYYLIKYKKLIGFELGIIYVVTFIYMMISGNSLFSYKLFIFLIAIILMKPYVDMNSSRKIKMIKVNT